MLAVMATTWASKQEAIRSAVALALGVPDRLGADGVRVVQDVQWENRPRANERWGSENRPVVSLRLGALINHGRDERRDVYDCQADRIRTYYCGTRHFTVSVTIAVPNQLEGKESPGEWASRLRTRLHAERIRAVHQAADVALIRFLSTQNVDEIEINGRMMSVSVTDLRFATVEEWEDNDTVYGDYVAGVDGEGEFLKPGEEECGESVEVTFDTDDQAP